MPDALVESFHPRALIVNADDFGMSLGVNRGILDAHRHGIVTSASLMVRWPAAGEAVALSRPWPRLSLGLHVDLGEWAYRDGAWVCLYEVVPPRDLAAVTREVLRQLDVFRELTGRNPTHLDSHQHFHREEPVRTVMRNLADELSVPLRDFSSQVRYSGSFYGQTAKGDALPEAISAASLLRTLAELPPGVTELGCHPGLNDDLNTMYRQERAVEVSTLCDERVRSAIHELRIELYSFQDLLTRCPSGC
jgi:predicted glycoside hydrolase/deacetylase ChbG (UPF0249 family)